jgi:RHS repeat-associated protein
VSRHDYLPFGEELFAGTGGRTAPQGYTLSDNVRQKFTLKERDVETGLDFFGARYHSPEQGRFTSVDPSRVSVALSKPQSWNRYVYALNNPMVYQDRNGMWPTEIHELIIDLVFARLTNFGRDQIKSGSWSVDNPLNGGQFTSHANEHGMTMPGQSQDDAANKANAFIEANVTQARELYNCGNGIYVPPGLNVQSLWRFGRAWHTVSDMTSPAHEGYQVWQKSGAWSHAEEEEEIAARRLGLATGASLKFIAYVYGETEMNRVTGGIGATRERGIDWIRGPGLLAMRRADQNSNPGAAVRQEAELIYEFRIGFDAGLNFDWRNQNGRRKK